MQNAHYHPCLPTNDLGLVLMCPPMDRPSRSSCCDLNSRATKIVNQFAPSLFRSDRVRQQLVSSRVSCISLVLSLVSSPPFWSDAADSRPKGATSTHPDRLLTLPSLHPQNEICSAKSVQKPFTPLPSWSFLAIEHGVPGYFFFFFCCISAR